MKKKIVLLCTLFILLMVIPVVSASFGENFSTDQNDYLLYESCEDTPVNGWDDVENVTTTPLQSKEGSFSCQFNSGSFLLNNTGIPVGHTWGCWIRPNSTTSGSAGLIYTTTGAALFQRDQTFGTKYYRFPGNDDTGVGWHVDSWNFVAIHRNTTNLFRFYGNNNTDLGTETDASINFTRVLTNRNGWVDGCRVWKGQSPNDVPIQNLTHSPKFEVSVRDQYDSSIINNFTVYVGGQVYPTVNGSAVTELFNNETSFFNVTIQSNVSGGYFNKTYFNLNLSVDLEATIYQAILNLNATEKITGNPLSGTFQAPFQSNESVLFLKSGTYNITFNNSNYFLKEENFVISALSNTSATIDEVFNTFLNVTAKDLTNSQDIQNFTINASVLGGVYSYSEELSTTSGSVTFGLLQNFEYNLTFTSTGHQNQNTTLNVTNSSYPFKFLVYTTNSINFTFRDEVTDLLVTDPITIEFIGTSQSYNFTTNGSGKFFADLLAPSNYTIRYRSDDWGRLRQYLFTLTNGTHNDLTLYLINETESTETIVTVYDQTTLATVEESIIYLQRYFLPSNEFRTVAMYKTDVGGQAVFDIEHDNELYKFIIDKPWQTTRLITEEGYITSTSVNLYISLEDEIAEGFFDENGISSLLSYDGNDQEFTVTYNDPQLTATQHCLTLKEYGQYGKRELNRSCSSMSSSTIALRGLTANKTNYAVYSILTPSGERVVKTGWVDLFDDTLDAGRFGILLTAVLFGVFAFISIIHIYAVVLANVALIFSKLLGLLNLSWGYIITLTIASLILAIFIQMKKS